MNLTLVEPRNNSLPELAIVIIIKQTISPQTPTNVQFCLQLHLKSLSLPCSFLLLGIFAVELTTGN